MMKGHITPKIQLTPLFCIIPFSTGEINSMLRQCLHKCGLGDMLTLHSFCRGGATFYSLVCLMPVYVLRGVGTQRLT